MPAVMERKSVEHINKVAVEAAEVELVETHLLLDLVLLVTVV
jgi:hypothetical protein